MDSLRKAFYHLKMAEEYFSDVVRDKGNRGTIAEKVCREYVKRVQFIQRDFSSNPQLPSDALDLFRQEMRSDIMFHESISAKSIRLKPHQKEAIESAIDCLLTGEEITVVVQNPQ